jgi:hypothetical protein
MLIRFAANTGLGGLLCEEAQGIAEPLSPRTFVVSAPGDFADRELAVFLPAFGEEEFCEFVVVGFIAFVQSIFAIVEEHAGIGWECGGSCEGGEFSGFVGEAFGEVFEGSGEAGKSSEDSGVVDGCKEGIKCAEGSADEGSVFGRFFQVEAFFEEWDEFADEELGVGGAAAFGRELAVAERLAPFIFSRRVVDGGHNAGRQGALRAEQADPLVECKISAGEAGFGIKNIVPVAGDDERVFFTAMVVAVGKPDGDCSFAVEDTRGNGFCEQASRLAVPPIRDRVRKKNISGHIMHHVRHAPTRGVTRFRLPRRAPQNFVGKSGAVGGMDFADMKWRLPAQFQCAFSVPFAEGGVVSANADSLPGPVNRRENLKSNSIHTGSLSPWLPHCTENSL